MLKRSYALVQQHLLAKQLVRFGIIGGAAATVNFLVVIALVSTTHLTPLLANVIAFLIAFQVSFHGHKVWTFEYEADHLPAMTKFFIIASLSFLLNESLYAFFLQAVHMHYQLALLLVLIIVPPITYLCSKFWAFR